MIKFTYHCTQTKEASNVGIITLCGNFSLTATPNHLPMDARSFIIDYLMPFLSLFLDYIVQFTYDRGEKLK